MDAFWLIACYASEGIDISRVDPQLILTVIGGLAGVGLAGVMLVSWAHRPARNAKLGRCPTCAYPVGGLAEPDGHVRCPECGRVHDTTRPVSVRKGIETAGIILAVVGFMPLVWILLSLLSQF